MNKIPITRNVELFQLQVSEFLDKRYQNIQHVVTEN